MTSTSLSQKRKLRFRCGNVVKKRKRKREKGNPKREKRTRNSKCAERRASTLCIARCCVIRAPFGKRGRERRGKGGSDHAQVHRSVVPPSKKDRKIQNCSETEKEGHDGEEVLLGGGRKKHSALTVYMRAKDETNHPRTHHRYKNSSSGMAERKGKVKKRIL